MKRLLIVDDEEMIANGLYEIFSGLEELELDVYKAYSADEAIEWINRTRMDIVLTDINMPGMDGLQLFEYIIRQWPACKVIFLTGHPDFEYIYKAIQYPRISYVLKSEDNEKIISAVQKAVIEIREENKTEELVRQAKEQMNTARKLLQRDFFMHLLYGDLSPITDNSRMDEIAIPLDCRQSLFMVLARTDTLRIGKSWWEEIEELYSVRHIMLNHLGIHVKCSVILTEQRVLAAFVQPMELTSPDAYKKTLLFLQGTLEAIQNACRDSLNLKLDCVYTKKECSWDSLSENYCSLGQLLNYRINPNIETLLNNEEFSNSIRQENQQARNMIHDSNTADLEIKLRQTNMASLRHCLETGKKKEFFSLLNPLMSSLEECNEINDLTAREVFQSISLLLLSYINSWKLTNKVSKTANLNQLAIIPQVNSWKKATAYLTRLSHILFEIEDLAQKKRTDSTIEFVENYIRSHLSNDLSLVSLSELVYLNPSYLSRLYKQTTGRNISEYIESSRIQRAKVLLEEGKIRVCDIAREVGYDTATSFTRFFKKCIKVSPQEYRDTCLSVKIRKECKELETSNT